VDDWPNAYDWDTDEEHREAGDRLKRHQRAAESIKDDPTLQSPADQQAIKRAIEDTEHQLKLWAMSRARRRDFQRRKMLPPD
jgi:hypothetical protein